MDTLRSNSVDRAAEWLRRGELVAIPTETVYGLAANGLDPIAVARIFAAKERPAFDPLILHLAGIDRLDELAHDIPDVARQLAEQFWPGPLTLVLPRRPVVPDLTTSGLDTVGLRMPDHPLSLALLRALDFPLAAPSANPFGYISPTTADHVLEQMHGKIAMVLDGGPCRVGIESTIVGFPQGIPTIYRLGGLARQAIESVAGPVQLSLNQSGDPRAPGQLASHYAPRTPLSWLIESESLSTRQQEHSGVLAYRNVPSGSWGIARVLSTTGNPNEAAANLFKWLRELDAAGMEQLYVERLPQEERDSGLGAAIQDRLLRAVTHGHH